MKIHSLFFILLATVLFSCTKEKTAQKPNVVVIVADDFGWADTGFQGSEFYETPNLDKLASEGTIFTDGYASCGVCSPSRASLLTGRYTPRSGITDWIMGYQAERTPEQLSAYKLLGPQNVYDLPSEETTIAEAMKENGYKTCFVGKWHLGEDSLHYPQYHGFDKNIGGWLKGGPNGSVKGRGYYTPYNNPYLSDGEEGEFLTDRLVDESIEWMNKNQEDPFLLYLSFYVVHTPIHPKPEKVPYYKEKAKSLGIDTEKQFTKDVEWIQNSPKPAWHWKERIMQGYPEYAALVESLDENIGRVLEYLKASGLDENTVVVFTSDNGGLSTAEGSPTCNAPLRGGKGWLYEGGIREPFIVKIPGQSQPGQVCKQPVHGIDVYPTVLDACGIKVPNEEEVDGVSLLPLINGGEISRDKLYWHYPHYGGKGDTPAGVIRKGDYKLIEFFETGNVELYNLVDDISESNDLTEKMPELKNELLSDLQQWRKNVGAKMPKENPYYEFK
jgi:arylsulfatase A-like enzyme